MNEKDKCPRCQEPLEEGRCNNCGFTSNDSQEKTLGQIINGIKEMRTVYVDKIRAFYSKVFADLCETLDESYFLQIPAEYLVELMQTYESFYNEKPGWSVDRLKLYEKVREDLERKYSRVEFKESEDLDETLHEDEEPALKNSYEKENDGEVLNNSDSSEENVFLSEKDKEDNKLKDGDSFLFVTQGKLIHFPNPEWRDINIEETIKELEEKHKAEEKTTPPKKKKRAGFIKKKHLKLITGEEENDYDGYYDPIKPADYDEMKKVSKRNFNGVSLGFPLLIGGLSLTAIGCFIMPFIT